MPSLVGLRMRPRDSEAHEADSEQNRTEHKVLKNSYYSPTHGEEHLDKKRALTIHL